MTTPRAAARLGLGVRVIGASCETAHGMLRVNVFEDECDYDESDPPGYRSGQVHVTKMLGGEALNVKVFEMPARREPVPVPLRVRGRVAVVLEGAVGCARPPASSELAQRRDVVCFPAGPAGAHKVWNRRRGDARRADVLERSRALGGACIPTATRSACGPGNDADTVMLRRGDGAVDYYDGER